MLKNKQNDFYHWHLIILLLVTLLVVSVPVYAESIDYNHNLKETNHKQARKHQSGFFYGAMLGYKTEIYKGVSNDVSAFPVVGYKSDKFNFLGPFLSYRLAEYDSLKVNSMMIYNFAGYESSDSSHLNGMEDRNASLQLGLGLSLKKQNWAYNFDALHDVIGSSNGAELKASIGKTFYFGPIFIEPNFGLNYLDSKFVDYYYGVNNSEVTAGREAYQGNHAINKNLGINISTPILFGGFTLLSLEQVWFDKSITDSPLTDTEKRFNVRMTFSRFF